MEIAAIDIGFGNTKVIPPCNINEIDDKAISFPSLVVDTTGETRRHAHEKVDTIKVPIGQITFDVGADVSLITSNAILNQHEKYIETEPYHALLLVGLKSMNTSNIDVLVKVYR